MNGIVLGQRLRLLRQREGMSQADLARALKITSNGLNLLELGKIDDPHISRVVRAASLFRVSADYLLGLAETKASGEHLPS